MLNIETRQDIILSKVLQIILDLCDENTPVGDLGGQTTGASEPQPIKEQGHVDSNPNPPIM
jgi:hypothetical protein